MRCDALAVVSCRSDGAQVSAVQRTGLGSVCIAGKALRALQHDGQKECLFVWPLDTLRAMKTSLFPFDQKTRRKTHRNITFLIRHGNTPSVFLLLGTLYGGCGEPGSDSPFPTGEEAELAVCSAALPAPHTTSAKSADVGFAQACLSVHPKDAAQSVHVAVGRGSDLSLAGYRLVGPPVVLKLAQPVGQRGVDLLLPFSFGELPKDSQRHRLVVLSRFGTAAVHVTPVENIAVSSASGGQFRFHMPGHGIGPKDAGHAMLDVGTFQVAMPTDIGQTVTRRFTYRAVAGMSMGGIGASMYFFRHPDRYDAIGVLGADPGPDLTYSMGFTRDLFFGGFCTAADEKAGRGAIGQACPLPRAPLRGQNEYVGSFEAMPVQLGEGIGLTLRRKLYLRANRDLARAIGNFALYNPQHPYLPPGVPASTLAQTPDEACKKPVVMKGLKNDPTGKPFYDGRFNPFGRSDVITFCDGGEADGKQGVFDPSKPQTDPVQIVLAVDVNGNGKRDAGEPVVLQASEPFADVGLDGLPDEKEPGYDLVKNPDPAGDNFHYLMNPTGTEGNARYDAGEPYEDAGLDGVKGKGCEIENGTPGCFDHGEGNGRFDLNPGLAKWVEHDPRTLMEKMSVSDLAQKDIYYDAGIRDFFNAHISTSNLFGVLAGRGLSTQLFGGFPALSGLSPTAETRFSTADVDVPGLGRRLFVRYGNPEITEEKAAETGDGRHAGEVTQVVHRALVLFKFLLSRWPDADTSVQPADDPRLVPKGLSLTLKNGRVTPFGMVLPPGYFEPQNQPLRYPVIYIGHGYGMSPEDLGKSIGSLIHGFMSEPDEKLRLPKAILVFVDAVCRPGGEVPTEPLSTEGDQCEEGAFYTNHPLGAYQGESMLDELDAHLRKNYRLKEPSNLTVPL